MPGVTDKTSLKEDFDNRSVIVQIRDISTKADSTVEVSAEADKTAKEAIAKATASDAKATEAKATADGLTGEIAAANATASDAVKVANNAVDTAEGFSTRIDAIATDTAEAVTRATDAGADAASALQVARLAENTAAGVAQQAGDAVATASAADVKATNAVSQSSSAATTAGDALDEANAASAKATVNESAINAVKTRVGVLEVTQGQQDVKIGRSLKGVEVVTSITDGTIRGIKTDGTVTEKAIPIASEVQAGLVNGQTMTGIRRLNERVRGLEEGYNIKYGDIPAGSGATQEEIMSAYLAAGGTEPVPVGARIVDLKRTITFVYDGTTWIRPDVVTVPIFGQLTAGLIKGGDPKTDGVVIAEADGTGSVQGWATVKADITNAKDEIMTLDGTVAGIDADVQAVEQKATKNEGDISAMDTRVTTNTSDIAGLKGTVGDAGKGLVKQVNDNKALAESASAAATSAGTKADNAVTAANRSTVSLTKSSTDTKVVLTGTKGDDTQYTVNIDAATDSHAGVMTASDHLHTVRDNKDTTINSRITFGVNPYVQDVKEAELTSQRVAPVKQIHAAFVNVDKKINGVSAAVQGNTTNISDLETRVGTLETTEPVKTVVNSVSDAGLVTTVNGVASEPVKVGGGGLKRVVEKLTINDYTTFINTLKSCKEGDFVYATDLSFVDPYVSCGNVRFECVDSIDHIYVLTGTTSVSSKMYLLFYARVEEHNFLQLKYYTPSNTTTELMTKYPSNFSSVTGVVKTTFQ